jgi:antitoxin MazE
MRTKIQRWGNSLGLRIPKTFAVEVGVEAGSEVEIVVQEGEIVVRPGVSPRYELDALLREVTAENLHREVLTGAPVGREAW